MAENAEKNSTERWFESSIVHHSSESEPNDSEHLAHESEANPSDIPSQAWPKKPAPSPAEHTHGSIAWAVEKVREHTDDPEDLVRVEYLMEEVSRLSYANGVRSRDAAHSALVARVAELELSLSHLDGVRETVNERDTLRTQNSALVNALEAHGKRWRAIGANWLTVSPDHARPYLICADDVRAALALAKGEMK